MNNNTVFTRIQQEIDENPVVLFMKGTPMFPQCGFSSAVAHVLSKAGVEFKGIDVLADAQLREGIKEFTQWPTIPQLYIKGEFIGGCDIVRELAANGDLAQIFKDKGIKQESAD